MSATDNRCELFISINRDVVARSGGPSAVTPDNKKQQHSSAASASPNNNTNNNNGDVLPRRVVEFHEWHQRRERLRPSSEEIELEHQLRQMVDRRRRRAAKIARIDHQRAREEDERLRQLDLRRRKEDDATRVLGTSGVTVTRYEDAEEEELEARKEREVRERRNRVSTFEDLSFDIRAQVYEYLPVIPRYMMDDVHFICTFLPTDDAMCLYQPDTAREAFNFVEQCLEEHKQQFVSAAIVAIVLGLSDRSLEAAWSSAATTAASKRLSHLPSVNELAAQAHAHAQDQQAAAAASGDNSPANAADTSAAGSDASTVGGASPYRCSVPHQQRQLYSQMIAVATSELVRQRQFLSLSERWIRFERIAIDTPCSTLRIVLRECLDSWSKRVSALPLGTLHELLVSNIVSMGKRVQAVEFVGDPKTEAEDVRDMLWDALSQHLPEGVSRDYGKTLTLGQIVSLGIGDLPWVKGFAWQDRSRHVVSRSDVDITKMMSLFPELASLRELSLDRVVDTQAVIEARESEQRRKEEEARKAAEYERDMRIRTTAVEAMARRVWLPPGSGPRPFGSCEMCGSVHVHVVGLKKPGSAVLGDIAVCQDCYLDAYEIDVNPTIHKLYDWELVSEIVDKHHDDGHDDRNPQEVEGPK